MDLRSLFTMEHKTSLPTGIPWPAKFLYGLLALAIPTLFLQAQPTAFSLPYDLDDHQKVLSLSGSLTEISGLAFDAFNHSLIAVNDEMGMLFCIEPSDGKILRKIGFGKDGDYEGVTWNQGTIFTLKSNGNIYLYDNVLGLKKDRIKTQLKSGNDAEGIAFSEELHGLVIACKGRFSIDKLEKDKTIKGFYLYQLNSQTMQEEPLFTLSDDSLMNGMRLHPSFSDYSKKGKERLLKRAKSFAPSGIACHPVSGNYYILSSIGKLLVVVDKDGELLWVHPLDEDFHRQPEAICFDDLNNLYIGNEGKGLVAKIYVYESRQTDD